jgi:choline-glycine betaine transporter
VATFVVRAVCLAIFVIAIDAFMQYMGTVPEKVKRALIIVSIVQILSFLLVFFLDPGTLLDD